MADPEFLQIKEKNICSEDFVVDGNKWRLSLYPKGNKGKNHLSIYLEVANSETLPSGCNRHGQFGFAIIDQNYRKTSVTGVLMHNFNAKEDNWGYGSFLALSELDNPESGYLVNDACLIEVYVSTDRTKGLISHELIVENDSDKHKIKEADRVKAIEHEETTEKDMKTFFTRLESEISSSKSNIVYTDVEAKEALAKLEEALNMTPAYLYNLGEFSLLKQAFKTLANVACSSTVLTAEQKSELLVMEERLKGLADRATKAEQDKNHFTSMETTKLMVSHNLECSLVRYKEAESELEEVDQKLTFLHEQVEESQKKREIILDEQKKIFISSRKMKKELEALGNEWAEYETKAKAAEEEEKSVEAEWGRIKDFISSINGMI